MTGFYYGLCNYIRCADTRPTDCRYKLKIPKIFSKAPPNNSCGLYDNTVCSYTPCFRDYPSACAACQYSKIAGFYPAQCEDVV